MQKKFEFLENNGRTYLWVDWTEDDYRPAGRLHRKDYEETFKDKKHIYTLNHKLLQKSTYIKGYGFCFEMIMNNKEQKICSYTQNGCRLQLLKIGLYKYQIRENRKIIKTTMQEYQARKIFAQMVTNIVLQLKIY